MLAIRLTPDIESRLEVLSKRTGRTKTHFAREAILLHLEEMENFAALAGVADAIYADVLAGREKTYSTTEVLKDHGLELGVDRNGAPKLKKTRSTRRKANPLLPPRKARAA